MLLLLPLTNTLKKLLLLLIYLTIPLFSIGQFPLIKMQKSIGGTADDEGDYSALVATPDGGYVVTTSTTSNDGDVSRNHGSHDIWAVKFDSNDQIVWKKCIGGSYAENGAAVIQCTDGGLLFYCATGSNDGDISGNHGSLDFCLIKTDSSGNILWRKLYGGTSWDYASKGIQTSDGGFLIGGNTSSNNGDVSGNHGGGYKYDIWLLKVSGTGTLEWQKCFGGTNDERTVYEIIENANDYTIVGDTSSNNGDVINPGGGFGTWIFNIKKSDRNINWQKVDFSPSYSNTRKMTDGTYFQFNAYRGEFYVRKLAANGNWISTNLLIYNQFYDLVIEDMVIDADGGFVFLGSARPSVSNNQDLFIVKFDANLNLVWQKSYGGFGAEYGRHLIRRGNDFVIFGSSDSNDSDVSGNHGGKDIWLVRLAYNIGNIKVNNPFKPFTACSKTTENTALDIEFSYENLPASTFIAQLSDVNGSFDKPINIGSSTGTTIHTQIPPNLLAGKYKIRIKTATHLSYNYANVIIPTAPPTATLTGVNVPDEVYKGERVNLKLDFTGASPWNYTLSNGISRSTDFNPAFLYNVSVEDSTPIHITNVNNACGNGTFDNNLSYAFNKYCAIKSNCTYYGTIRDFALSSNGTKLISNPTNACSTDGWGHFTNFEAQVNAGASYTFDIKSSFAGITIYIDYNRDSTFTNSEIAFLGLISENSTSLQGTINIPANAVDGKTMMRVIAQGSLYELYATDPCDSFTWGETEDYTLNISSPCKLNATMINPISTAQTIMVDNAVNASNIIQSTGKVSYSAGKKIDLQAGFEAKKGSVFKAFIQGCEGN